jgi:hypothetical protein
MRTSRDQLGKQMLSSMLRPWCKVKVEQEVAHEPQTIDVCASPGDGGPPSATNVGLLARMVEQLALFEPYSDTVGALELNACQRRQLALLHEQQKTAEARRTLPRPRTWLLSPGRPDALLRAFSFTEAPGWPAGFYEVGPGWALGVVVLRELPRERDTLPLRLLGRERVLRQAVEDLRDLPAGDPLRAPLWEVLHRVRASVILDELPPEEKDTWMLTEQQFDELKQNLVREGEREGMRKGLSQGVREAIADLCEVFGIPIDPARRAALEAMDVPELEALRLSLKQTRRWD